jgi:hypothetical protein
VATDKARRWPNRRQTEYSPSRAFNCKSSEQRTQLEAPMVYPSPSQTWLSAQTSKECSTGYASLLTRITSYTLDTRSVGSQKYASLGLGAPRPCLARLPPKLMIADVQSSVARGAPGRPRDTCHQGPRRLSPVGKRNDYENEDCVRSPPWIVRKKRVAALRSKGRSHAKCRLRDP